MEIPKILVIDDEPAIHKTFRKAMKNEKYELLSAENGKEGLQILEQTKPDLIFLDLKMPVMDGFTFLEKVTARPADPYLVIVITGHGYDEEVRASYERGVNFFLRKPLSMIEICGLAKSCLDLKTFEQEIRTHRDHLGQLVKERTYTIHEQLHFQQNLINSIPTPVFYKDSDFNYLGGNTAFAKSMSVNMEEIVGRTIHDIAPVELADQHHKMDKEVLTKGCGTYEIPMIYGDGSYREIMICMATFNDMEEQPVGLIGTMFDITERKRSEEIIAARSNELEQANTAMRVVLDQIGDTKNEVEKRVYRNVKELVLPDLDRIHARTTSQENKATIEIIKANLSKLTTIPSRRYSATYRTMSPREIQIADLIRLGKTNKSIALLLNISKSAVEFHRNNLREKLGLKNRKINLRTFLMNME